MSGKKRRSVSLSPDNYEFLKQQDNGSALVNRLLTQYREGGDGYTESVIRQYRLVEERAELEALQKRLEVKQEVVSDLEDSVQSSEARREEIFEDAADVFDRMDRSQLTEDNIAVENWSDKADVSESEILDWYFTEHCDGGDRR